MMVNTRPLTKEQLEIIMDPAHITPRTLEEQTGQGYKPVTMKDMLKSMDFLYKHCKKEMDESLRRAAQIGYDGTGQ